ncbi:MAG: hypothetical protein COV47_01585 [Candidatus Diapherotrites archaeon CG11_big_fil_rev_8_21_14_0_20_37_9]|nr:MAG: hypothetical protein COV47_01585 [Candidatus Diapherotrites archaeon CG11_big_fil_rev_8_21_14_0_20_37_9]
MTNIPAAELSKKAKEINDNVFGRTRKKKRIMADSVKESINECAKFALEKTLKLPEIRVESRVAFIELLRDQPDMINILLVSDKMKPKAIEMLKPLFGEKSDFFIAEFLDSFSKIHAEVNSERQNFHAS